jgi:hypothetical protein
MPTYLATALTGLFGVALIASCGTSVVAPADSAAGTSSSTGSGAAGTGGAPTSATTSGDSGGAIGFGGFAATSGGSEVGAGGSPDMPGLFDCGGCLCDGATHYCRIDGGGGPTPPPGPPPMPTCPEDPAATSCKPLPAECLSSPTCACLGWPNSICSCAVEHEGIVVKCVYP